MFGFINIKTHENKIKEVKMELAKYINLYLDYKEKYEEELEYGANMAKEMKELKLVISKYEKDIEDRKAAGRKRWQTYKEKKNKELKKSKKVVIKKSKTTTKKKVK